MSVQAPCAPIKRSQRMTLAHPKNNFMTPDFENDADCMTNKGSSPISKMTPNLHTPTPYQGHRREQADSFEDVKSATHFLDCTFDSIDSDRSPVPKRFGLPSGY